MTVIERSTAPVVFDARPSTHVNLVALEKALNDPIADIAFTVSKLTYGQMEQLATELTANQALQDSAEAVMKRLHEWQRGRTSRVTPPPHPC